MRTYDFAAIGLGPFNLGLACLAEPIHDLDGVFLEARDDFSWHPGMMLADATLQVPFLADLVTMADPTSRFSFLAFLKQAGRLYPFYIRESFYPLRAEYDQYCRWAAAQIEGIRFGRHVHRVEHDGEAYVITARLRSGAAETYRARRLVLGTGTQPHVPASVRGLDGPMLHTADYLTHKAALQATGSITIVGSGQSAAEVYLDLLEDIDSHGYELTWATRSPRFFPMEYTKLTLEMTSPEYTAYFQALPMQTRDDLLRAQRQLYKGISGDLIDTIYDTLYRKQVHGEVPTRLLTNTELTGAEWDEGRSAYDLDLRHTELDEPFTLATEALVLATGYRPHTPGFVGPVADRIRWDERGRYAVTAGYTIDENEEIFVQNAEEHTHGLVAPDLGMGAFRNSIIVNAMCGREVYRVEERIAFQEFGGAGLNPDGGAGMTTSSLFSRATRVGRVTFEPVDVDRDAALLHHWVTHPRSVFWGMQSATVDEVREAYAVIDADANHHAWLGRVDGEPAFLAETYDPTRSELATVYDVRDGDIGMHVLVAPTDRPRRGFTSAVFRAVMELCLDDSRHQRVVVEPDVRNDRIAALNAAAGFRVERAVELADKTAALSTCTREQFAQSDLVRGRAKDGDDPRAASDHLTPEAMEVAHRFLITKALAEFSHERLLVPEPIGHDHQVAIGGTRYRFHAHRYELEHWVIEPWSVTREVDGVPAELDALAFIAEHADVLGIPAALLPTYLEEISSTLASAAWKHVHGTLTSADLVHADFQAIEAAMTEGHPAFVANNGRIGFSASDFAAYAPEAGQPFEVVWLAVLRTKAHLSLGEGLDEEALYAGELDALTRERFAAELRDLGLDPDDYLLMPAHPWQWEHKLAITFAPDVARRDIVCLGTSDDRYRAQQSIRTFFNADRPERHYVKTALSIQNMGFMRGLSPRYMRATPAINDWVAELVAQDEELRACGFGVLRERAAIGYTGDAYHRLGAPSAYTKMLAALWRESPLPQLAAGERLATMASLLHRDRNGGHLVTELIAASGVPPREWVASYLRAYVRPVVHCLHRYELAFMPHGENLILVLEDHVPTRVLMKDIGEEIAVMGDLPLPADIERVRASVPDRVKPLAVLTDVFDGFLRFLAGILAEDRVLGQDEFWSLVADTIAEHQEAHPELAEAFARIDLFTPEFDHSCLNRLQLRDTRQMVDLSDQAESLIFAGALANPIARFGR